jgi:uncharacterized protein YdeI (YjbR/CyaY-like superfamily)
MTRTENFQQVEVTSAAQLREWLLAHHTQAESIWLVTYKKQVPEKYVSIGQVLDELLCFGWIDGIRRKLDDERTMQLISPRQAQHWAKTYKERVARLIQEGRMHEAGLQAIEASKRLGLWDYMADVDALLMPEDLRQALESQPPALEHFMQSATSYQRNVLRWLKLAKTAATRSKRLDKIATFAERDERIPQM